MFKKVVDVVFPFPFVDPLLCNQRFGEFARLTWPLCGNLDIVKISKQIVAAGVPALPHTLQKPDDVGGWKFQLENQTLKFLVGA